MDRLVRNTDRLTNLLTDLLDVDRAMRGALELQRRPTDLAALVRAVMEGLETAQRAPLPLDCEPIEVAVDARKIERAVEGLMTNALRHAAGEAPVVVTVRDVNGEVRLTVDDRGARFCVALPR